MSEQDSAPLLGGRVTPGVVRVADTVRRPPGANAAFVRRLLRHLEAQGFAGAPRLLGVDGWGREVLSYIVGEVILEGPPLEDAPLIDAARLVRDYHDATAGSPLAGDAEVVCHTDLGPHNTIFRDGRPVALIDWDDAAPGRRLDDVATAVWCYGSIGEHGGPVDEQARRIRVFSDAYGWPDPHAIVAEIGAQLRRALERHQREGRPAAAAVFRPMVDWWTGHAAALVHRPE